MFLLESLLIAFNLWIFPSISFFFLLTGNLFVEEVIGPQEFSNLYFAV